MIKRTYILFIAAGVLAVTSILMNWQPGILSPSVVLAGDYADEHEHGDKHGDEHQDEDGDEHDDEHEEGVVELDMDKLAGLKLSTVKVRRGALALTLDLPGEVQWNANRVAHVVPRVPGVVRRVHKGLGDKVGEGDVLAELDSGELASTKAAYLTAHAREQLAKANFEREKKLWEQNISAERDYLEAKNTLAEVRIQKRLSHLQLLAIGVPENEVINLPQDPDNELTLYRIIVPFAGIVVDRHITHGELLKNDSQAFKIVDTSTVWIMGQAYERDLRFLRKGQKAVVRLDAFSQERFEGVVDYIASELDPETRSVDVRIVLANPQQRLRAGMFGGVTVFVDAASSEGNHAVGLLIPRAAIQRVKDVFVIFQRMEPGDPGKFKMVPVRIRNKSKSYALVTGPLQVGDDLMIGDTFLLKSEAAKEEMGGGHSH